MQDIWPILMLMLLSGAGLLALFWRRFGGQAGLIVPPFAWMAVLYLLPVLVLAYMSFGTANVENQPPFDAPFGDQLQWQGSTESFRKLGADLTIGTQTCFNGVCIGDPQFKYRPAFINSAVIALFTALIALVIAFPFALAIARSPARMQGFMLMGVILPFWSFYIIRVYAFRQLVRDTGPINEGINAFNAIAWLPDVPNLALYPSAAGMVLALVYTYLPFAILPLYASLQTADPSLEEAAADLGASRLTRFWTITLPLAAPGLIAASLLVAVPSMGEYVIPQMMSQNDLALQNGVLGFEIRKAVTRARDWPLGALLGLALMALLIIPMVLYQRSANRLSQAEASLR